MNLINIYCTKCGKPLQVNGELEKCMCQYCGNEMWVKDDKEAAQSQSGNAFQAGYEAELGRQKAMMDAAEFQRQQRNRNVAERRARAAEQQKTTTKYSLIAVLCAWTSRTAYLYASSLEPVAGLLHVIAVVTLIVSIVFLIKCRNLSKSTYCKVNIGFTIWFYVFIVAGILLSILGAVTSPMQEMMMEIGNS